jgi:hypothetical protein
MKKALISALLGLVLLPAPSFAWGFAAHRYITRRAIDLLPSEVKPFFLHFGDELVVRAIDPDLWRTAGWEDDPNHFLDLGIQEFGPYPFTALPRELGAAIEKFGMPMLKRNGLLPWREAEEFGNLRRAFEDFKRNGVLAPQNTVLFAAVAAHYIQDAHQPLHATNNFDGQLTNQNGVHARFESALFERFQLRLTINPSPPTPMKNPRDAAFDILLASHQLVQALLDADKEAIAGKDAYDDDYFEKFFAKAKPMLERRIGESITATAALISGAWEQAGKPQLKTDMPRTVEKVRSP